MKKVGIAVGSETRLKKTIATSVRLQYAVKLKNTRKFSAERAILEQEIASEINRRLNVCTSKHSLW